jgi:nucleotide-binding universal stress UspA family protein
MRRRHERVVMAGPVLLCFDGSEHAAEAIRAAGVLFPGRDALVLSIAIPAKDEFPLDPVSDLVGRLSHLYREWDEMTAGLAKRHALRGCELAAEAGLHARPLTATGKAAPTILRVGDEHDADVIVLGAGNYKTLGRVAARVLHATTRPVLVSPGHGAA